MSSSTISVPVRPEARVREFPDQITAYVVQPSGAPKGAVIVIHEAWGLVPHIKQVAERYAAEGFLAIAPDILSAVGIEGQIGFELHREYSSPDDSVRLAAQPRVREAFAASRVPHYADWAVGALKAVVDYLLDQPGVKGRVAVTGLCFGGTYSFALAAGDPRVMAVAPYYGTAPAPEKIPAITAPIHAFYGQHDPALLDALPAVTEQMGAAGVDFETTIYPDAGHAFFNDTGANYRADDAADAWRRTLDFFHAKLG
ncbi:hypothetical protein BH09ACT3_BH09ACT3_10520 [soil metagenome]